MVKSQQRPTLSVDYCLGIVIDATNRKQDFETTYNSDVNTTLNNLGIIDSDQADNHKQGIQDALFADGYRIKQSEIKSGPSVTVLNCLYSVRNNAK